MKFSDKALRLISRELKLNTSDTPDQERARSTGRLSIARGLQQRKLRRQPKAAVLPFKKRLR